MALHQRFDSRAIASMPYGLSRRLAQIATRVPQSALTSTGVSRLLEIFSPPIPALLTRPWAMPLMSQTREGERYG